MGADRMKLLFDISVLGMGQRTSLARTGVFRVVENLAIGLASAKGIQLELSASAGNLADCCAFLATSRELGSLPLAHDPEFVAASRRLALARKAVANGRFVSGNLSALFSKFSMGGVRRARRDQPRFSDNRIFHSPYHAFPDNLAEHPRVIGFLTVHDLIPLMHAQLFPEGTRCILERALAKLTPESWVFTISNATKNDLCAYAGHLDPDRVLVTHPAASEWFYPCSCTTALERVKAKYGIPDGPYLLSCCTLEPRKNVSGTVTCFLELVRQERIHDLNLVLVGAKGWHYGEIFQTIARDRELAQRIIVTGYVADEELAPLYSGALAFVYPSLCEGFGLPPLEAMQCATPVITSTTSSLPEVVGDAGILVPPTDVPALCQAMHDLYRHQALRDSLSARSLARARLFSWDRCVAQTIAGYRKALAR